MSGTSTGISISAQIDLAPFNAAMRGLVRLGQDTTGLMRALGVGLRTNTLARFAEERAPDGTSWAPLLPAYAAIKRGPGILRARGMRGGLQGSITIAAERDSVTVGSNAIHARVHQEGAVIKARHAPYLVFAMSGGLVKVRSVTIPARPYLGIGPEDEDMILDTSELMLARAMAARR
ncbi:phage virion morphogenesis protein [Pseudoroseomonas cervicalis]|uniref:Phage virion morphogenesis protein n=1 Tax=Pseudoroseomonas cervicalis ATCC 49957 TaxID=525371 RepID=D5RM73_9PROT|nr:phage virion morphogenesis protein [Pseudoroseomonas cervicalis]EFH11589.1 phage virion morphogenesis protein [Pseudoroseomonas cervicalis ATCC 49957]